MFSPANLAVALSFFKNGDKFMASSLPSEPISDLATSAVTQTPKPHLFISYKRKGIDEAVALEVFKALAKDNEVFIDQTMRVGTHWAERIEAELRRSDF